MMTALPMGPWHTEEWFFFLLSNAIIFYFCAPKVVVEFTGWLRRRRARKAG